MKRIAIFPGSFDPFTIGHDDIARRASKVFDEVIISIGVNSAKQRSFSDVLMKEKLQKLYQSTNIRVETYSILTADFAKEQNAKYIIRGLRNSADLNYEMPISFINNTLNSDLETVFFAGNPKYNAISSTIVRELHKYGKDISQFIPFSL